MSPCSSDASWSDASWSDDGTICDPLSLSPPLLPAFSTKKWSHIWTQKGRNLLPTTNRHNFSNSIIVRERERERVQTHGNKRYQSLYSLSSTIHSRLMDNCLDDDANCIIVTITHECSPVDCSNCFPRVLGICADRPMTVGENSFLPNSHTPPTVCFVKNFFQKKVILLLCTHCAKFSESGTVGFGQERGKLGTGFWRNTNFSCNSFTKIILGDV